MFRLNLSTRRSLTVTTVADDMTTLESLGRYLQRRVSFRAAPDLETAFASLAASDAVVFYPDGYAQRGVQSFVSRLISNTTLSLVIVVTKDPERFRALSQSRTTASQFIVLSQPAWPWELFATIAAGFPYVQHEDARSC